MKSILEVGNVRFALLSLLRLLLRGVVVLQSGEF